MCDNDGKDKGDGAYSPPSLTYFTDLLPPGQLPPSVIGPDTHKVSGLYHTVLRQLFTGLQHRNIVTLISCHSKYLFPLGRRRPVEIHFIEVAEASRNSHILQRNLFIHFCWIIYSTTVSYTNTQTDRQTNTHTHTHTCARAPLRICSTALTLLHTA